MKLKLSAALLCAASVTGCASIVSGVSQPVTVETRVNGELVSGVTCKMESNKGVWYVTTPGQVTLHRGFQDLAIECNKPDMTGPLITKASSHVRPIFFGNILFGGLIGIAVDTGDGAAFDYDDVIAIDITPKAGATTVTGMPAPIGQQAVSTSSVQINPQAPAAPAK
jgi:hypothetical protein